MATKSLGLLINFIITGKEIQDCKVTLKFVAQLPESDDIVVHRWWPMSIIIGVHRIILHVWV